MVDYPTVMTLLQFSYLISKRVCVERYWALGTQCMNVKLAGGAQFSP
jgi:hypothetical protein